MVRVAGVDVGRNEQIADEIVAVLKDSGLGYDDQVKAISIARVKIQPRAENWREKSKPILRPKEQR
jgi:hypothetical protein